VWFPFTIDLTGVTTVNSLTVGVTGGAGMLLVDDIRLYPEAGGLAMPVVPDTANLAGYWSFDKGTGAVAADASGNGNNATLINVNWVDGAMGKAVDFDGSTAYATIPAAAWDGIEMQATLALWTYINSAEIANNIAFKASTASGARAFQSHIPYGGTTVYFDAGHEGAYDRVQTAISNSDIADAWIHWAFVRNVDTGMMKIYRNGVVFASASGKSLTIGDITSFTLGASNVPDLFFNASMDEVRLYDRELSQAEIQGLAGNTAGFYPALD
jgi:hypothetical protein